MPMHRLFKNIETMPMHPSGAKRYGISATDREFRIAVAPTAPADQRWKATALRPQADLVNELHGPTMASISAQLAAMK